MSSNSNIVVEWLRSLHLSQYAESFLDNGYDDLEICKQVGDPDLDAIGVFNPQHRGRLLQSVRTLREEGAASVYFTLEESAAIQEECQCESASARSSRNSSGRMSDKDVAVGVGRSPAGSSSAGSAQELTRYLDEYEEGKAELVRIPRIQLKMLLKDKLQQDGIKLSNQPYSNSEGGRGYLEGLASRYADLYNTHYRDVLDHLEELRRRDWADLSPRIRVLGAPSTPPGPAPADPLHPLPVPLNRVPLTTSHSQPIYVPGKYSPSSCLSDKEEDEIYGFAGYGVYGKQMMLQRQQQAKLARQNYQNCLSPRSAYFYEFPPNERAGKKRTSFSRFLKHLTTHRKEKSTSPKIPSSRGGTPDNLDAPPTLLPPVDYDRARCLPRPPPGCNSNSPNAFEETIHRLKLQEALKKKERFDREHEEILRDIRQGLLQLGRGSGGRSSDDTYMYDDDMQRLGQHWYDEPPYESDPEDFLMADTAANSRVCYTLNVRADGRGGSGESAVISLRSAGDISLPHHHQRHQRGLLLPQSGPYPPALIPLTHARAHRESGDYAASDVQSVCSRLSSLSMETSRSETTDHYQRLRSYNGGESAVSPGHSSDYADHDELVTVHSSCGSSSMAHRVRGLKASDSATGKVVSSRHPHKRHHPHHHAPHHSSAESLPSGSSTQALVPPSSNHSSEECTSPAENAVVIAHARALVDYTPSPYDKDVLKFKKGDLIEVLSMNATGLWRGRAHNRVGNFKFINVELLTENSLRPRPCRHRPQTLEQMLRTIHMEDHMSLFVLNGYEDLDTFCDIEEKDLDYLKIYDLQKRAKILAAVQVLNEYESPDEGTSSTEEGRNSQMGPGEGELPANNLGGEASPPAISCKEAAQLMQQPFHPNIPLNRSSHALEMNVFSDKTTTDAVVEKVGVVKYIGTDISCESGNPQNRNCSLSEKSSDSGVSSSSLSSSNHNATRNKQRRSGSKATLIESPTRSYVGHFVSDRKD